MKNITLVIAGILVFTSCKATPQRKAWTQQKKADLVIMEFRSFDEFSISKPERIQNINQTKFNAFLSSSTINRDMVVVVRSKLSPKKKPAQRITLESIEKWLRDLGFKRIVIQQMISSSDHPDGLPVLKDSKDKTWNNSIESISK